MWFSRERVILNLRLLFRAVDPSPYDLRTLVEAELLTTGHPRDLLSQSLGDNLAAEGIGMVKR